MSDHVTPTPAIDAPQSTAPEAEAQTPVSVESPTNTPQRYKLKVDEEELDLPLEDVLRYASKAKGADKRFEQAHQVRKQAEMLLEGVKQDPVAALTQLGIDFEQIAVQFLGAKLERDFDERSTTPEQRAARERDRELEELRQWKQQQEEGRLQQERAQLEAQYTQTYESMIIGALEKGGIPKTPAAVRKMALYLQRAEDLSIPVTPDDLVDYMRSDLSGDIKAILGEMDPASVVKLLGDDLANKIRKHGIDQLKSQPRITSQKASTSKPKEAERKYKDLDSFLDDI